MQIQEALTSLGNELGVGELQPNAWGVCDVYFDDAIRVSISGSDERGILTLFAQIGVLDDPTEATLENLLAANYLGCGTEGARLALDESGLLFLNRTLPAQCLTHTAWIDAVSRFVNAAEFWIKHYSDDTLAFTDVVPMPQPDFPAHWMVRV